MTRKHPKRVLREIDEKKRNKTPPGQRAGTPQKLRGKTWHLYARKTPLAGREKAHHRNWQGKRDIYMPFLKRKKHSRVREQAHHRNWKGKRDICMPGKHHSRVGRRHTTEIDRENVTSICHSSRGKNTPGSESRHTTEIERENVTSVCQENTTRGSGEGTPQKLTGKTWHLYAIPQEEKTLPG